MFVFLTILSNLTYRLFSITYNKSTSAGEWFGLKLLIFEDQIKTR